MDGDFIFKKSILLDPETPDELLDRLALQYKKIAETFGYPDVFFGVYRDDSLKGIWVGCDDYFKGLECSVAVLGPWVTSNEGAVYNIRPHKNAHIDRFITESIMGLYAENDVTHFFDEAVGHSFQFKYMAGELTFLAIHKRFESVPLPENPSRPPAKEPSFYAPFPSSAIN